jgi:hypothetical protein
MSTRSHRPSRASPAAALREFRERLLPAPGERLEASEQDLVEDAREQVAEFGDRGEAAVLQASSSPC